MSRNTFILSNILCFGYWPQLQSLPQPDGKRTMEGRYRIRNDPFQIVNLAHWRLAASSL